MPKTGYFVLHSNVKPKVLAGKYDLQTEQAGLPFNAATEHTHITVSSPRYTMPTEQILSTFPPANAVGAFGDRLPQIVLKRRTLPWERDPDESMNPSDVPWLALVVVAEGEAELSTATPVAQCMTPGKALLDPSDQDVTQGLYLAVTETVVNKVFPAKEDLPLLAHVREVDVNDTELANGDDDGWLAVIMANRLPVFDEANGKPVRYMACLINIESQLEHLAKPPPPTDDFTFELAQDWRALAEVDPRIGIDPMAMGGFNVNVSLPQGQMQQKGKAKSKAAASAKTAKAAKALPIEQAAKGSLQRSGGALDGAASMKEAPYVGQWKQVAEKVNAAALDPNAKVLVRDTMASGFRLPISRFALETVYRFPVLAHWSFTTNEGATFETLMQHLDVGLLGTLHGERPNAEPEADPKLPPPAARPEPEVVETGHIGLDHRTRRGDTARAWYRGPMVPFPMLRDGESNKPVLAHAADQLRRVVPDGREDLALAAAFEIGRLLALSQLSVVSALLRFRSEQFGIGRLRETLAGVIGYKLPELVDKRIDFGRFVAMEFIGDLVTNPETMLGPRRPVADPGRELKLDGDLDQVIAAGLGLDLVAVTKLADQVGGMLGAVARTPVSVAEATKGLTPDLVAHLQATLDASLGNVLNVAMPQQRMQSPKAGPGAKGAKSAKAPAHGRDPLDALIERTAVPPEGEED